MDMRWLRMRVISPNRVRMNFARMGISILSSFSTANEKHCSLVILGRRIKHQHLVKRGMSCRQLIHRDVVQTIKVRQSLEISLILYQLLRASVQQPDMGISTDDCLALQF